MQAHIPDNGIHSQLDVLASCIGRALVELDEAVALLPDGDMRLALSGRVASLGLLWQTYEVLAGNFEQAGGETISAIARLEAAGLITKAAADELMLSFEEALGVMYVNTMAVQPE